MAELPAADRKIIRVMEYYFGDFNLPRDKHLLELIKKDQDGWVPMEEMLKFNRLRSLSEDVAHICDVLKKSTNKLLEVAEDNTKVRRSKPMPEDSKEHRMDVNSRTLHVKGFPATATLDEIDEFLEPFGSSENIFMKRDKQKKNENGRAPFKGTVWVTFSKLEEAKKMVATADLKFQDQTLTAVFKNDHYKKKDEDRKQSKKKEKTEDSCKKEKGEEEEEEEKDEKTETLPDIKQYDSEESMPEASPKERPITKNAVLLVEGVNAEITLESLKTFWNDFGQVGWVQFEKGDDKAYVRFKEENMAVEALEKAKEREEELKINNVAVTASVVTGEEEEKYWRQMREDMEKRGNRKGPQRNQRKRSWGNRNSNDWGSNKKRGRRQ